MTYEKEIPEYALQPAKTPLPTEVTPLGISTAVSLPQPENRSFSKAVTPEGMVTLSIIPQ